VNIFRNAIAIFSANTPEPFPSPTVDPAKVQPGVWYAVMVLGLVAALVVLLFSMNRHLKKAKISLGDSEQSDS